MANLAGQPLDEGAVQRAVTVDLQVHFIRATRGGSLHSRAQLLHAGRRLAFAECKAYDERGEPVAQMSGSYTPLLGGASERGRSIVQASSLRPTRIQPSRS